MQYVYAIPAKENDPIHVGSRPNKRNNWTIQLIQRGVSNKFSAPAFFKFVAGAERREGGGEFSYSTLDFARKSFAGASQILTNFLNNNRGEKGNSAQIIRLRGTKIYVYRDKYGCLR